jgi:hypothetical protein
VVISVVISVETNAEIRKSNVVVIHLVLTNGTTTIAGRMQASLVDKLGPTTTTTVGSYAPVQLGRGRSGGVVENCLTAVDHGEETELVTIRT